MVISRIKSFFGIESQPESEHEFGEDAGQDAFQKLLRDNTPVFEKNLSRFGQIRILDNEEAKLTDSKFGGEPFWPEGKSYPTTQDGDRMAMIAQVNCADVPSFLNWPSVGIVQFFITSGDFFGLNLDNPTDQSGFRVIYHEDTHAATQAQALVKDTDLPFDVSKSLKFEILEGKMLPGWDLSDLDPELKKLIDGHEEEYSEYCSEMFEEQFDDLSFHQIGGFPTFVQADPRDESQAKREYSTVLLQIDSDDGDHGIMWGDCGTAQFFTSAKRLKAGDFSQVMYDWACC